MSHLTSNDGDTHECSDSLGIIAIETLVEPMREAIRVPVAVKTAVKREKAPDFSGASSV